MRNKLLPRLAAALWLAIQLQGAAVFLSAAWAQVPPPVPALPDTERRTQYSISGTTCACSVNFQLYGSGTDIDSWIEVWVAGTRYLSTDPTVGWSLSSATGTLATIPRPITNAVLTFNSAQTGIVQILGAERPRRLSQFAENRGVAARDLNQAVTDLVAVERELWDKTNDVTGRAILGPPGEAINKPLPNAAVRAAGVFIFDSSGNPTTTPLGTAPLTMVGPTGTNARTSAYAAVTGDCGKMITLAGSAFYTLTIGAPGGFALNCFMAVNNLDTTHGKTVAISGITTFILWPGQTFSLFNSNGTWVYVTPPPGRWNLTAPVTLNLDSIAGSDSNDGLSTGTSWLTLQHAWDTVAKNYDTHGFVVTFLLADGTYASMITNQGFVGQQGGAGAVIAGNASNPQSVVIKDTGGNAALDFGAGSDNASPQVTVQNVYLQTAANNGINGWGSGTYVALANVYIFSPLFAHVSSAHGAEVSLRSGTTLFAVSGGMNATAVMNVQQNGRWISDSPNIQFIGSPNYTLATFFVANQGMAFLAGGTFTGTVTGSRFSVQSLGLILTGTGGSATYLPGNAAGTVFTGGIYN